jgi:Nucleotidyl transferase AbiEii toxin, Type IV TA system
MLPDLVRKDYWVTRVLRALAEDKAHQGLVLFKGGTSLSKGWRLIKRFSEDVDLLLTGPNFGPMPERPNERVRQFKTLRGRIESETPLRLPAQKDVDRETWNFLYMRDDYHCNIRYPLPGGAIKRGAVNAEWVLIESGFRGGVQPHSRRPINSLIGEFLQTDARVRDALGEYANDFEPFEMDLLKPERTFAEKILLLHVAMSKGEEGAHEVRMRHYSDVAQLFTESDDVKKAFASGEMGRLFSAAADVSNRFFNAGIDLETVVLRDSRALAPTPAQIQVLRANYESPLERAMYFRDIVPFDELMERVRSIRDSL